MAALTLPAIIHKQQDVQFKSAYKKAYSDISQAFQLALFANNIRARNAKFDEAATISEFKVMKEAFKVAKDCPSSERSIYSCWKKGDSLCGGSCSSGNSSDGLDLSNGAPTAVSNAFIDASGRSWAAYSSSENIYLVDTNGFKGPNLFGKDRWYFMLADKSGNRISEGYAVKVITADDVLSQSSFCKHPPCYYKSWLLK